MSNIPTDLVLTAGRNSLAAYSIISSPKFENPAHIELLIRKLEAVERGETKRLMIFMPPRHGKSFLTAQRFPAWYLGRHPDRFVISASYGQELADDFGRAVRNLLADPIHKMIFPECDLSDDSASMNRFNITAGGSYFAVGCGGAVTGRGAHLFLIDDPIKGADEARSETVRRSLQSWYSQVAYTRLAPGGAIVVIQTRWHLDDLAGWQLREHLDEGWDVLSMPAIAEEDESFRKAGEALWPAMFPIESLQRTRQAIGGAAWQSLYQQRPVAAGGAVFKREWWKTYEDIPKLNYILQSWDTAFKTGAENDYSVGTTWGRSENGYYLLDVWKGRAEFPELKRQVRILAERHRPNIIIVEDKASGQSLIQEFQRMTTLPVIPVKVDTDKVTRAQAVTPSVEAGKVYLPKSAPWLADYVDELSSFPSGVHDDQVDSTTLALHHLRLNESGVFHWYQQQAEALASGQVESSKAAETPGSNVIEIPRRENPPAAPVEKTTTRTTYGLRG